MTLNVRLAIRITITGAKELILYLGVFVAGLCQTLDITSSLRY
jgi:hypothetical protein